MTKRIPRVNQLIKEEVSRIILREAEFLPNILATVTRVETSPNLNESKIYISCLPETEQKNVLNSLNSQVWRLQQLLNHRLKMRPLPKIKFLEERKTSEAAQVEEILEKLKMNK